MGISFTTPQKDEALTVNSNYQDLLKIISTSQDSNEVNVYCTNFLHRPLQNIEKDMVQEFLKQYQNKELNLKECCQKVNNVLHFLQIKPIRGGEEVKDYLDLDIIYKQDVRTMTNHDNKLDAVHDIHRVEVMCRDNTVAVTETAPVAGIIATDTPFSNTKLSGGEFSILESQLSSLPKMQESAPITNLQHMRHMMKHVYSQV